MTLLSNKSKFKHPVVVQIGIAIVVAIFSSYLTLLQASIPRNEVNEKIQQSDVKAMNAIDRLDNKQDQILNKLEDLQFEVGVIKGKLEASEKRK